MVLKKRMESLGYLTEYKESVQELAESSLEQKAELIKQNEGTFEAEKSQFNFEMTAEDLEDADDDKY